MSENIFIETELFGNLFIYDVLMSYIYPRIFICQDDYECKYLFYDISEDEQKDEWIVVKIKKDEYYSIIDGLKSVQSYLFNNKQFYVCKKYLDESDSIECRPATKTEIDYISKTEYFVKDRPIEDIRNETLCAARDSNSNVFDLRFFAGSSRHSIPCNIMADLCNSMSSMFNHISGKKTIVPTVSTAFGSCVVRFTFQDQINLFEEYESTEKIKIMNEIISNDNFLESVEKVEKKKEFISAYTKFMQAVKKTETNVEFMSAFPNSSKVKKISLNVSEIQRHYDDIKTIFKTHENKFEQFGKVIAWDTKSKKFKIEVENRIISGNISQEYDVSRQITINENYNFIMKKYTKMDQSNYTKSETYEVINVIS